MNSGGGFGSLIFMAVLILVFYMLLIRPQKRRVAEHRALVDSVQVGDEVVTIGGVFGTVRRIDEEDLDLEIAPGTTVRFVRSAIARRITEDADDDQTRLTTGEETSA